MADFDKFLQRKLRNHGMPNDAAVEVAKQLADSAIPMGEEGKLLSVDATGAKKWVDPPAAKNIFRGAWEADSVARQFDFSGTTLPTGFTRANGGAGAGTPSLITVAAAGVAGAPSAFSSANAVSMNVWRDGSYSILTLTLSALAIEGTVTRVTAWMAGKNAGDTQVQLRRNGSATTAKSTGSFAAWEKWQTTAIGTDVIDFANIGVDWHEDNTNTFAYVTGVEVYAASDPYMLGEFVTHMGKMWKSSINNNASEPGVGNWVEVLDLPAKSGTTAARPSAVTAGVGYCYFDTTLGKPVWSDGAAWKDATGTAV